MSFRAIQGSLRLYGSGCALPRLRLSTEKLLKRVEENMGIKQISRQGSIVAKRMGIEYRHISRDMETPLEATRPDDSNPKLSARALAQALSEAAMSVNDISYLIGHTTSPHTLLPPNTSWVADELDYAGPYMELRQACTGFANALQVAYGMILSGSNERIAIVGSETGSVFFDPRSIAASNDQLVNLVQMGDGAGAVIVGPNEGDGGPKLEKFFFGTIGVKRAPGFYLSSGGSTNPYIGGEQSVCTFEHDFNSVREHGPTLFREALKSAREMGVDIKKIDWFLPHQANGRIDEVVQRELGIPKHKVLVDADQVGNLGSASIWVALARVRKSKKLKPGDTLLVLGAEATKFMYGGFVYRHA